MAVKHFCDKCGKETTDDIHRNIHLEWKKESGVARVPWYEINKYLLFCQPCFNDWLNLIGTFLNEKFN